LHLEASFFLFWHMLCTLIATLYYKGSLEALSQIQNSSEAKTAAQIAIWDVSRIINYMDINGETGRYYSQVQAVLDAIEGVAYNDVQAKFSWQKVLPTVSWVIL